MLLVDQRGHGHSTRRPPDTSRAAFVADIIAVIEAESRGPVMLIGHSMGAHTAMLTAATRPDLVDRLVLLEATPAGTPADEPARLADYFSSWPVPFVSREAASDYFGRGRLQDAWVASFERHQDGYYPRFDADIMRSTMDGLVPPRWREWEAITAPSLVVFAGAGMFSEQEKAEAVSRGRNTTRVDLAGADHDAHLDAHDTWIRTLIEFLQDR